MLLAVLMQGGSEGFPLFRLKTKAHKESRLARSITMIEV